jgi:hypothetical protein
MTGFPESRWLFTRGEESVRLVREEDSTRWRLSVFGPGAEVAIREFGDLAECMKRQAEFEQCLLAEGYQVAQHVPSDRRHEHGTWHGFDQRRTAG